MAIAFEGFSIREYASKMRSVDVMKCWPFGVDHDYKETERGEEIDSLLPPITIRKYRWWSNEVGKEMRSEQVGEIEKADLKHKEVVGNEEEMRVVMICPVCGSFSASTVNAVNAHIDSCLAQVSREERRQMRKAKSKPAKKRSIVDIFAVAPQIDAMVIDCADKEEHEENSEGVFPRRKFETPEVLLKPSGVLLSKEKEEKKKKKKNKKKKSSTSKSKEDAMAIVKKLKLKVKKKKKKRKKKMTTMVKKIESSLKREKCCKGPSALDHSAKLKSSTCNKKLEKKNSDTVSIQKRKVSRKNLSMENQQKAIRASKFLTKHHQQELPVYPIQSILKNQKRVISCQKSSAGEHIQDDDQTNSRNVQHLNRRVRFSEKDDILGPAKEHSSSIVLTKSKNFVRDFSDVMNASSENHFPEEVNRSFHAVEALKVNKTGEDNARSVVNGIRTQSKIPNVELDGFQGQISVPPFLSRNHRSLPDKEKGFFDGSLSLSQAFPHHGSFSQFNQDSLSPFQIPYAGINRFLHHTGKEWCDPVVEPDGSDIESVKARGRIVHDPLLVPTTRSNSLSKIHATSRPLATHLSVNTEANRRLSVPAQTAMQNSNGCGTQFQPFYHMPTKDLMSSIAEWKRQKTNISWENCIYDDFIGLPLNSQGELINLHSSGKRNFDQTREEDTMKGPVCCFSAQNLLGPGSSTGHPNIKERHYVETAVPKDKLTSFSEQNLFKDSPKVFLPSEVGTELQGSERTDSWQDLPRENNQSICRLGLDLNLMNISACGYGTINPIESEKEKIQREKSSETCNLSSAIPTMRLMGKDVAVGRVNTLNSFDDGMIWTNKEIITEHCPKMISDNSSASRHFQEEVIVNPVIGKAKETVTRSLEPQRATFSQMKYVDNRFAHSYLGSQTMPQNGPLFTSNGNMKMQPLSHSPASQGLMNRTLEFPQSRAHRAESGSMSSHLPLPSSAHIPCQPLLLNSASLGCNQSVVYGTSAVKFPFEDQDCGEYVPPLSSKYSSQSLPQWMLNSTQQKEDPLCSRISISDRNINQHSCGISGANFLPVPLPHCTAMTSHRPSNTTVRLPHIQTTLGATSSALRPLIPVLPGFKPNTSISTSYRSRAKIKEKSKSKHFRLRDTVRVKKDKKRPADKSDASAECTKKPNLEMEVESSTVTGLNQSTSSCHTIISAEELDANTDKRRDVDHSPIESHKDGFRSTSGFSCSNMDNMTRSGPIKLSAGAKHILKPSHKIDQDNSRPIHSTIPFGAVTNSYKATEIQKKSSKIYRF